ncbi:MAG: hypothetical protein ACLP9D_15205 [Candidatus Bathyarchaeia archaeon]
MNNLETGVTAEGLKTLKLIEEAWEDIQEGRVRKATPRNFFKELSKWRG